MKLYKKNIAMLMAGLLALSSGSLVTSCDDDDDYDTNQFSSGSVSLTAASLQVTRSAYMTFKGTNLDRVTSVEFPGGVSSTPEVVDELTIRALVPEGAEPGTVKLIYDGGELETKQIAFTEPITFDKFSPAEVTPGDELTITGTYLTYIDFVSFATGENVEVKNTNRTELKLNVPLDASTGKIKLGYYSMDGKEIVETILESKEILKVAEPSELKITNPKVKAGENVVITGKLLRLVEYVSFNGTDTMINVAAVDPTKDRESIKVALPAEAKDGDVTLTLFSGLEFVAGQVKTVVPTAAIKDKKDSYGVGDIVTIEGENLDLIISGTFDGTVAGDTLANGAPVFVNKDGKISMTVTAAAKSGNITLSLANGITIPVEGFVTTKPVFTFPADATPLDVLEIESTLASRVTKVLFGELEAEASVSKDGKKFSVTVPLDAETGSVSYVMDNGETGAISDNFTVNGYTFCAVKEFAADQTVIGELMKCTVSNGANLTGVKLNGEATGYILSGDLLFVNIGQTPGKQRMILVSGDKQVEYIVKVVGQGVVMTVLYDKPTELTKWSANYELNVDFSGVPSGAMIRINFEATGESPKIKAFDGHWANVYDGSTDDEVAKNKKNGYIDLDPSLFPYSDWGYTIIIQGDGMVVSAIGYVVDYSAPTTIWTGSFSNKEWAGNQDLAWGNYDWSLVEAGQTLYFTVKKVEAGKWGCISLRHGDKWGALVDAVNADGKNQFDVADEVDATTIEFTLTQAAIDDLVANGGLVITGDNLLLSKVAIK